AIRKEAGHVIEGSVAIPNAAPHGWSDNFVGGARGISPGALLYDSAGPRNVTAGLAPPAAAKPASPARGSVFSKLGDAVMSVAELGSQESFDVKEADPPVTNRTTLFSGKPQGSGEVILFDSSRDQAVHPAREAGIINRLLISFEAGAPPAESL